MLAKEDGDKITFRAFQLGKVAVKVCNWEVLTLSHLERPKLHTILAFLSAVGLIYFLLKLILPAVKKQFLFSLFIKIDM